MHLHPVKQPNLTREFLLTDLPTGLMAAPASRLARVCLTEGVRRRSWRLSGRGAADCPAACALEPVRFCFGCGPRVLAAGSWVWGRSPVYRVHRSSHCRQSRCGGDPAVASRSAGRCGAPQCSPCPLCRQDTLPAGREKLLGLSPRGVSVIITGAKGRWKRLPPSRDN